MNKAYASNTLNEQLKVRVSLKLSCKIITICVHQYLFITYTNLILLSSTQNTN